jgi:L-lactate dehydrogenase complex protein LldG
MMNQRKGGVPLSWQEIEKQRADQLPVLVERFREECELVSVKVHGAKTRDEARHVLSSIIRESRAKQTMRWDSPLMDLLEIDGVLEAEGVQTVSSEEKGHLAELGISGADYALADTGTLVLRALPGQDRSVSLLPPVHVAIVESVRILHGLDDLLVRVRQDMKEKGRPDSCMTLISGPSKTADIEMTLVLGVHGPKEVHVILLEEHG